MAQMSVDDHVSWVNTYVANAKQARETERESLLLAAAQVHAIAAIASGLDRLAAAIEATDGRP